MTTATHRSTVRLYAKRPKERRWKLVGEYPTREAAWNAITAVPKGFAVWMNDQSKPSKELTTVLNDKTAVSKSPLPNVTREDLQRIGARFAAVARIAGPMLAQVQEVGQRVLTEQLAKLGAELDKANAVATDVFRTEVAKLAETADASTD